MKELITTKREIPKVALDALSENEKHILATLFEHQCYLQCHLSLHGYRIELYRFTLDTGLSVDIFKNQVQDSVPAESFRETLKNFITALYSYETKNGVIYIKDNRRERNHAISAIDRVLETYYALCPRDFRMEKVTKDQALQILESMNSLHQKIINHAISTAPSY